MKVFLFAGILFSVIQKFPLGFHANETGGW
jgi:hypothetical protein